jgi:hypothetical protein
VLVALRVRVMPMELAAVYWICNLAPVPASQLLIWVWLASIASDMACSAVSRLVKDDALGRAIWAVSRLASSVSVKPRCRANV